jgi:hypothetical protein
MATRYTIGMIQEDGSTIRSVYGHWDGYPEGAGATLAQHYTDPAKIERLLAGGDISVLDADIGEQTDFDSRVEGITLYYRDRGEDTPALVHANQQEWLGFRKGSWCEWGYLWADGQWHIFKITGAH